jgi:two-component system chemotaxis response regulator CheY
MKNVLIVDDSESIRVVVETALNEAGYNVFAGENGEEGLQLLIKNPQIDLIISDFNMPIMDGITFLKKVRQLEEYKYLPVLMLTTETQGTKKVEAKKSGATGWITKPFDKEQLISIVKKVIR